MAALAFAGVTATQPSQAATTGPACDFVTYDTWWCWNTDNAQKPLEPGRVLDGDPVDLGTGQGVHQPFPDITVHKPVGPDVVFERTFSTQVALAGRGSGGLPVGWMHNWDITLYHNPGDKDDYDSEVYERFEVVYPNGAHEGFSWDSGELVCAEPNWRFAARRVSTVPTLPPDPVTIEWKDGTRWAFQRHGTTNFWTLRTVSDRYGSSLHLGWSDAGILRPLSAIIPAELNTSRRHFRLSSITNDLGATLLSCTYKTGQLTFDADNRLTLYRNAAGSTLMTAGYSPDGLRWWKGNAQGTKTCFLYDGPNVAAELNAAGTLKARNTFGADGLIRRRVNSTDTFCTFDPLGNVSEMGSTVVAYDAYGQQRVGSNATPFGHGGRYGYYRDSETGLAHTGPYGSAWGTATTTRRPVGSCPTARMGRRTPSGWRAG